MSAITAAQTQTLEGLLIEREKQLQDDIASARQRSRERLELRTHEVTDLKEDADDEAQVEVAQAEIERDLVELNQVKAARERLAVGRYGVCADCAEPIGFARLMAQPAASRCAACQATHETKRARAR